MCMRLPLECGVPIHGIDRIFPGFIYGHTGNCGPACMHGFKHQSYPEFLEFQLAKMAKVFC